MRTKSSATYRSNAGTMPTNVVSTSRAWLTGSGRTKARGLSTFTVLPQYDQQYCESHVGSKSTLEASLLARWKVPSSRVGHDSCHFRCCSGVRGLLRESCADGNGRWTIRYHPKRKHSTAERCRDV